MRHCTKLISMSVLGIFTAAALGVVVLAGRGSDVQAQTPPAPCMCARATAIVAADEATPVPSQFYPRFGIVHCQCGSATCVSQIPYGSGGTHQLMCVR